MLNKLLGLASLIPGVQLPPELSAIAAGIGVEAMGTLLEKVAAKDKITDDEINEQANKIVMRGDIANLLTKDEFFHAFSHFLKRYRNFANSQRLDFESFTHSLRAIGDTLQGLEERIEISTYESKLRDNLDQLVAILDSRAQLILDSLSKHYHYASVQEYAEKFENLHLLHITALRKGNLIHAHEILKQINELSTKLENDEFWTRHEIETPNVSYKLNPYGFEYGRIITGYLSGFSEGENPSYVENVFEMEAFFDFLSRDWHRPQRPPNVPYDFILASVQK